MFLFILRIVTQFFFITKFSSKKNILFRMLCVFGKATTIACTNSGVQKKIIIPLDQRLFHPHQHNLDMFKINRDSNVLISYQPKSTHVSYSPLEQFNTEIIYPISIGKLDLSLTYINIYLLIGSILIFAVLYYTTRGGKLVPKFWQSVGEISLLRIAGLTVQQAGYKAKKYIQIFFVVFFFILGLNVIGLIPMGFTATRHILITLGLSFRLNLGLLVLGFFYHGVYFLKLFVPSDAPKPLLPLIVIIELVRYIIRPFSLAIRLFANMMAGHTLLFILSGFVLAFLKSPFFMFAIFPLILVFAIVGLEIGISFLQAYVFTVLFAIYSNDALNLH